MAFKFSQIAPVFIAAQKAQEEQKIESNPNIPRAQRDAALKSIEDKYDTKNNLQAIRPVLGRRDYIITAFCITYKYKDGHADASTALMVAQPIRPTRAQKLLLIMADPRVKTMRLSKFSMLIHPMRRRASPHREL